MNASVDDAMADMIVKEVAMLRRLKHPNIISYRGVRIKKKLQTYDILLEYMNEGSLSARLKEEVTNTCTLVE